MRTSLKLLSRLLDISLGEILSQSSRLKFNKNVQDISGDERKDNFGVLIPVMLDMEENPCLMFTRRSRHLRKGGGQVSFPGGGMETGDASIVDTALREAFEEVIMN